ncbi:MAG TPA: DUF202 domain-containing protein [Nitriliruptorales bacterium]
MSTGSGAGDPAGSRRIVDEGMQAERTSLAWERTALAMAANAGLLSRAGFQEGVGAARTLGLILLAVSAAGFSVARTRYVRRDAAMRGEGRDPGHHLVLAVGVTALVASVGALATTITLALR